MSSTKNEPIKTYDQLPVEVKSVILAFSVLIDRISSLSKADRNDLFSLVQALQGESDKEEIKNIVKAMEEILAQFPLSTEKLTFPSSGQLKGNRKAWAEHIGKKIRILRENAGLTQIELAQKSGLPQSHISRIENAEYSPTNFTLERIAKALNCSVGAS